MELLKADLILLHAPSVYDFRERDDVLFAYLSGSDSVNVTSIYEMYPLGFLAIRKHLREQGLQCEIVNIASLMLQHPGLKVDRLLRRLESPVFGFDLHWMAQCHGSIELAKKLKSIHPEALTVFGGISATYFAEELISYACVDVVVQGYDTLRSICLLVENVIQENGDFSRIPNLIYKSDEEVFSTGFTNKPTASYNDVAVDWSYYRRRTGGTIDGKLIMTLPNTGCAFDCSWCGGSSYSYRRMMGVSRTLIRKDQAKIAQELRSLGDVARQTAIYALQCYSETRSRLSQFLDVVKEMGYRSVSFEQFHLTPEDILTKMAQATEAFIMLSPESHDLKISRLAGRGNYSMVEMEQWIPKALNAGIRGVVVWFFIGMPEQGTSSVRETVVYAETLIKRFGGYVLPVICPMVPFLDPGSRFFEEPDRHGYRIFHRNLESHRRAMLEPVWYRRLNYETKWMTRKEIQLATYDAISRLVEIKGEAGILPDTVARAILMRIEETRSLLDEIEAALMDGCLSSELRSSIRDYNRQMLSFSSDQIFPVRRAFGGRWFDNFTVPDSLLLECM